jgi:hypothetical protein
MWISPGNPVSSTNNTDRHDIAEILLKVALNTINQQTPTSVSDIVSINGLNLILEKIGHFDVT